MTQSVWRRPESAVALAPGEVHIWRVHLDRDPAELGPLLSEDERERAARFHFETDRTRYIVAHHALRSLLGRYRGATCPDRFELGPHGKPGLGGGPRFNLSHSRGLGLVAFAGDADIGVDLEAIDAETEVDSVAESFFSPPERKALRAVEAGRRRDGFFHIWCQKEAYLKGRGDGVVQGLDHFDVVADPLEAAGLLADRRDPLAPQRWTLLTLEPGTGFRGALAVRGGRPSLRCLEWS